MISKRMETNEVNPVITLAIRLDVSMDHVTQRERSHVEHSSLAVFEETEVEV